MESTENSSANVPVPPEKSAPQILQLSREDLGSAIKADYEYLQGLRRLTAQVRRRFGLKITEYANRFHGGKIAPAARELGINEKTASEWANFGNRYRDVPDNQLPETRDEARKGRRARSYRKTGAYSKKKAGDRTSASGTAGNALGDAPDANPELHGDTAAVPQKKRKKRGGYARSIPLDEVGRPLPDATQRPDARNTEERQPPPSQPSSRIGSAQQGEQISAEDQDPDDRTEEEKQRAWIASMKIELACIGSELAAVIGWTPVFQALEEARRRDQEFAFEEVR